MLTERDQNQKRAVASNATFTLATAVFFVMVLGLTGYRIYGLHYTGPETTVAKKLGFCDFYNGVYYPTQAFLNRDNPYRPEINQSYPVSRHVPFYSPLIFILHAPITLIPIKLAAVIYFALLTAFVLAICRFAVWLPALNNPWGWTFLVAGCLLLTRPGQNSLFNGYFTVELIFGTCLALHFGRTRPWLAAIGLALCSIKPNYAIPLLLLMACRGHWRATLIGGFLATVCFVGGMAWISDHRSMADVIQTMNSAQSSHHGFHNIWPSNTWTRVDLLSVIAKWNLWRPDDGAHLAVMLAVLLLPGALIGWVTWQTNREGRDTSLALDVDGGHGMVGLTCMLAMLVSIYHHSYDTVILVVPLAGMMLSRFSPWREVPLGHRAVLGVLIGVPFFNYLSAKSVIDRLGLDGIVFEIVTSINGVCLTAALLYSCWLLLRQGIDSRCPTD